MKITQDKRGLTLIETLVSISVIAILMGLISAFVIRAFYINRYVIEQGLNASSLQNSIRNFTTNVREAKQSDSGAYMIESCDDFELVIFSNIDDDDVTERAHYYLEDGQLKLGIAEPSGFPPTYPSEDEEVRVIGNGVVNTTEQKLFYYFGENYPEDTDDNPLDTPASPQDVNLIKMDIYMNVNTDQVPDSMRMETFVRPRNIE